MSKADNREITGDEMLDIARDGRLEHERWAARESVRERRRYALLQVAAVIFSTMDTHEPQDHCLQVSVDSAQLLLAEIESREVKP